MNRFEQEKIIGIIGDHRDLIYKICTMYAKQNEDIEDIFQEICIQLWRSYPNFKNECKLTTWMYRVSLNTAISWVRKEIKHAKSNDNTNSIGFLGDDFPFYLEAEKKEQIKFLYKAINFLSKPDKTLVLLYLEEVSYEEISEILGISEGNIRVKMNRIRKQLKNILSHETI